MPSGGGLPVVTTNKDLYELAARTGSPSVINRSGKIIFSDDFEDGCDRWYKQFAEWSAHTSFTGGFVCQLNCPASGAKARISRNMADWTRMSQVDSLITPLIGLEGAWSFSNSGIMFGVSLQRIDGNSYDELSLTFSNVVAAPGIWITQYPASAFLLPNSGWVWGGGTHPEANFHWFKIVADFTSRLVKRIWVDGQYWDLTPYKISLIKAGPSIAAVLPWYETYLLFDGNSTSGGADKIYIDNVVFTVDEPEL